MSRSTFSAGSRPSWHDEEDGFHDQLPSVEEVRTRAALQLARVDSIRSLNSTPRTPLSVVSATRPGMGSRQLSRQLSSPALYDNHNGDGGDDYSDAEINDHTPITPAGTRARVITKRNWMFLCFVATTALLIGAIAGLAVGIAEGKREVRQATPTGPLPSRQEEVIAWLGDSQMSDPASLADTSTPQYQAAVWVADTDPLRVPLPKDGEDTSDFVQRYALTLLYMSLNGPNWTFSWNFVTSRPTCSWNARRLAVDGRTFQLGASCNGGGRVTGLHIPGSQLEGTLVSEIALLSHLRFFAVNNNQISGTLPPELQTLVELDYFALHWNLLSGSLPSWVVNFKNLRVLGLGNNQFVGSIPAQYELLTNLVTLGLDDNLLTGNLDYIQDLRNLKRLYLEDNNFVDTLQASFLSGLALLEDLDLSDNSIGGTLPRHMFTYPALNVLDLHGNRIEGGFPTFIPNNENLTFFSIHDNLMTGEISSQLSNLKAVTHMDLAFNNFTGTIPPEIGAMSNLRYLFLASLNLQPGEVPAWIGQLTALQDLSLKLTNRNGQIPNFIGTSLTNLVLLDLDSNDLSGSIPTNLGMLRQLNYLLLNRNQRLSGTIPESIQMLTGLEILLLDRTSLAGNLNTICSQGGAKIIGSDCGGANPEVTCDCCTIRCEDDQTTDSCLDRVYLGQLDPIWENSYQRRFYQFAPDIIFGNE